MSIRKTAFVNNEYYHIFNRGVDKRIIFDDKSNLYFFFNRLQTLNTIDTSKNANNNRNRNKELIDNDDKLVDIIAYCLLPNHYHLLVKQLTDGGISKFMQRLGTSYTTYYNQINERSGSLFQGKFKANHLIGDYGLSTVATYVNLNYKHHKIDPKTNLVKSSIFEYLDEELGDKICNQQEIKNIIHELGGVNHYKQAMQNFSITFAENKGISLDYDDFEF
jgi:REP element-mobilizing transposase RayT